MNADELERRAIEGFEPIFDPHRTSDRQMLYSVVQRVQRARSRLAAAIEQLRRRRRDWHLGETNLACVEEAGAKVAAARLRVREAKAVALEVLERHVQVCAGTAEDEESMHG